MSHILYKIHIFYILWKIEITLLYYLYLIVLSKIFMRLIRNILNQFLTSLRTLLSLLSCLVMKRKLKYRLRISE